MEQRAKKKRSGKRNNKIPSDAVLTSIMNAIAVHGGTERALKDHSVNPGDFYPALHRHDHWAKAYAAAKHNACLAYAAQTLEIADELATRRVLRPEHVNLARLRVDTRKWHLSKLMPKVFGDNPDPSAIGGGGEKRSVLIVPGVASRDDWERLSEEHGRKTTQR